MSYLSFHRGELYYEDAADTDASLRDKPAVIFCNGWALSARYWTPLIALLSPHYRCIGFDQSGTGRTRLAKRKVQSSAVKQFTIDAFADEAAVLIEHLKLGQTAPLHIIGHSMGSMVAAEVYRRHAAIAASVTLTACGIFAFSAVQMQILTWFVETTISLKDLFYLDIFKVAFVRKATAKPIDAAYRKIIVDDFLQTDSDAVREVGTLSLDRTALERYAQTALSAQVPLLLLTGDKDKTIPPEGMTTLYDARIQSAAVPTTLVRFAELGHLPMLEDTPAYAAALREHLNRSTEHFHTNLATTGTTASASAS
ncbi:MAG: alpha/beta hydrolase [Rhizobacter sp.]|nr:alpha/beta hydrolase [Chlorobiales bacterium]